MDKDLQEELYNEIVGTINDHTDIMGALEVEETSMCRICMQCDRREGLITPCHCSGSVRYVHEECLKAWLLSKGSVDNNSCELCHTPFVQHFKLGKKCGSQGIRFQEGQVKFYSKIHDSCQNSS